MNKIKYINEFVCVNPLWYDDAGEIVRDPAGLTNDDPALWSVEVAHRDAVTGLLLWYVVADFDTPEAALAVACGALAMTAKGGPGDADCWLCYRVLAEPQFKRAYVDWMEWGAECRDQDQTLACRDFEKQLGGPVYEDEGCRV